MTKEKGKRFTTKKIQMEERRMKVSALALSGRYQRDIAGILGISVGTVNGDLRHLKKEWQKAGLADTDAAKTLDLKRIEEAIKAIWRRVQEGNLLAIDRLERLLRLKCQILGYAHADSIVPPNWQPITVIEVIKDYGPPAANGRVIDGEALPPVDGRLLTMNDSGEGDQPDRA